MIVTSRNKSVEFVTFCGAEWSRRGHAGTIQEGVRNGLTRTMSTTPRIDSAIPGQPPDFGSVMSHIPNTIDRFFDLYAEFWQNGVVDPHLKEMTRLRNARITDCGY